MGRRIAGLRRQKTRTLDDGGIVRDEHPATSRSDHLISVKGEGTDMPKASRFSIAARRAESLGGVLDEGDLIFRAERFDSRIVGALAIEIDGDDRLRELPVLGGVGKRLGEEVGIHIPALSLAVDEDRFGARVVDGVAGRREG